MWARYVFSIAFRLEPGGGVSVDPDAFETRLFHEAAEPTEPGWRFFRDNLWRGEIADEEHFRSLVEAALGVAVLDADYRAFETDDDYIGALREAIAADLPSFNDDSVDAVLNKYLASSIEIR